jgi:hypothetical protein
MERCLQNCLEQSKKKSILVDFTKPDGTLTTDINETITYMLDYLIANDNKDKDSDYHNTIRAQIEIPIRTADDRVHTERNWDGNRKFK